MSPAAEHDHDVTGITFVDDSKVVNVGVVVVVVVVVGVGDMTDLPVQEDEYDTDSDSEVDDDTPTDITFNRPGRAIRAHFRLDL